MYIKRIGWLILLILINIGAFAQDTVIVIGPALYEGGEQLHPAKWKGWYFRSGSDTAWAAKDLDMKGWKKMRPVDLSVKLADANGKVEGWFRSKIKMDSSLGETQLALSFGEWAAQDLYIDGKKIASAGNTGSNGLPYKENSGLDSQYISLPQLTPGSVHTLAWHITNSRALPFHPEGLKGFDNINTLLVFFTPRSYQWRMEERIFSERMIAGLIVSILMLVLLFWLLWVFNRKENNLFQFALYISLLALVYILERISYSERYYSIHIPYGANQLLQVIHSFLVWMLVGYTAYMLARVFRHPMAKRIRVFVFIAILIGVLNIMILQIETVSIILWVAFAALSIYVIITSLKKAKGADWAIVAGIFLTILFFVIGGIIFSLGSVNYPKASVICLFGYSLSFPLALLVYVAIRFREMISEARTNAAQVIKLSDEKRIQAEQQQQLLEQEVARQTVELRNSFENLKATQVQLIQSEKMASLGELTAGIAHEIQNPLNFVNNFSEVSTELVDEMNEELQKGNTTEAQQIAADLKENLSKINHHGKRAGDIVKGMLQHSRSSSGVKEPTDINALADEYLRLAYHGLRAKDKSFNATMKTDFDGSIGKINVLPQDLGRVILNLITNAFYAVTDKKKQGAGNYEPTVLVSTKKTGDKVMIKVRDNGMGIPQNVREKIFQPFFTTKPTGEGTGLGLSMSYDIITKGHGGEISVTTQEARPDDPDGRGEYTEFSIVLPV